MTRALVLALAVAVGSVACQRLPPPGSGAGEGPGQRGGETGEAGRSEASRPAPPPVPDSVRAETERLKALGPAYTPYEEGPRLIWDEVAQRAVVETLAPVIESRDLPVSTRALLWVLVGADGVVAAAVVQTSSSIDAFDRAALALAEELRFAPARTDGNRVPAWVIREISLLMQ